MKQQLIAKIQEMQQKSILVVGDLLLDKYVWGDTQRISPEAPVQVVHVEKETYVPGGASNVANNIAALGGKVKVAGIMGNDKTKDIFLKLLQQNNIDTQCVIIDQTRPTILKARVMAQNQQLMRIDHEDTGYVNSVIEDALYQKIESQKDSFDVIIISDYAKGVMTKKLAQKIIELAKQNNIPVLVDPKPKHKEFYRGATVVKPNYKEAAKMTRKQVSNENQAIQEMGTLLQNELQSDIILTRSENGLTLFEKQKEVVTIPAIAKRVTDVSGAGDTTMAAIALALAAKASLQEACIIGSYAASVVVEKLGTATVSAQELVEEIQAEK